MKPRVVDLLDEGKKLSASGQRVSILWQEPDSLVFVARGREYRSEFHINPSDEVMFMIKGQMNLHYRSPEGKEEIAVVPEGSVLYLPSGIPHSPRFSPDAYAMIIERKRHTEEIDHFQWYCSKCNNLLHGEEVVVKDYADDPVSQAYKRFFGSEQLRTCKTCGNVEAPQRI